MKKIKLRFIVSAVLLLAVAFGVFGCQQDVTATGPELNAPTTATLQGQTQSNGLIGGIIGILDKLLGQVIQLVLPQSGATLSVRTTSFEIPPLALTIPRTISYSLWVGTPSPGLKNAPNRVFVFTPEGLTFSKPCKMTVPFSELNLGNIDPKTLICYYYNQSTNRYEAQATKVDLQRKCFIVAINHFSQYAFGRVQD